MLYRNHNGIMLGYHARETLVAAVISLDEAPSTTVDRVEYSHAYYQQHRQKYRERYRRMQVARELAKGYSDVILR